MSCNNLEHCLLSIKCETLRQRRVGACPSVRFWDVWPLWWDVSFLHSWVVQFTVSYKTRDTTKWFEGLNVSDINSMYK